MGSLAIVYLAGITFRHRSGPLAVVCPAGLVAIAKDAPHQKFESLEVVCPAGIVEVHARKEPDFLGFHNPVQFAKSDFD